MHPRSELEGPRRDLIWVPLILPMLEPPAQRSFLLTCDYLNARPRRLDLSIILRKAARCIHSKSSSVMTSSWHSNQSGLHKAGPSTRTVGEKSTDFTTVDVSQPVQPTNPFGRQLLFHCTRDGVKTAACETTMIKLLVPVRASINAANAPVRIRKRSQLLLRSSDSTCNLQP